MAKVETRDDGAVRILMLHRPEVHNCVDAETATQLARAIETFATDDEVHVLVVTGAGRRAFCSGADLKNTT